MNRHLIDGQGRSISYMRVSITDRCNLRCRYCVPSAQFTPSSHEEIIRYEEIERLARILAPAGVSSIRITGGEPLLRRHLSRLIRALSEIPGIADISLTTNGLLLQEAAPSIKDAGLSRVNVSLDTLREDRFTWITNPPSGSGQGTPRAILRGLEASRESGLAPVKINVVLMRGFNDDELPEFAELTGKYDYEVRFIEFMPLSSDGYWGYEKVVRTDEIMTRLETIYGSLLPLADSGGSGPAVRYRIPGYVGALGFIAPLSSSFCHECNRIRITADGKLRTCLFSDDETDLITPMRRGMSDPEILALIREALTRKSDGHNIAGRGNVRRCTRAMPHIGG